MASPPIVDEFASQVPSVSAFTYLFAKERPNDVAFIDPYSNKIVVRHQLKSDSLKLAWSLRNLENLGRGSNMQRGDIITIFSNTSAYYPILVLGALAAGTPIACSSPAQTPAELVHQFTITRPKFFAVQLQLLPVFLDTIRRLKIDEREIKRRTILICEQNEVPQQVAQQGWGCLSDLLSGDESLVPENFDGRLAEETAVIVYSSGTTSLPKGVELTHRNLAAADKVIDAWGGYKCGGPMMGPFPQYHVAGLVSFLLVPIRCCRPCVVLPSFVFEDFLRLTERYKVSTLAIPPAVIGMLASSPSVDKYNLTSVQTVLFGAAPTPQPTIDACYARLKPLTHPLMGIYQGYGLSETSAICVLTPVGRIDKAAAAGLPIGTGVRIVNDNIQDVAVGTSGEVLLMGPTVMRGYLNNPKASRETFTPDGWLMSGDVGYIDEEGYLHIVDRLKELIKYNTFQVPPAELESVLAGHPQISDVCVIGVPASDGANELPRAYVVPRDKTLLRDPSFPAAIQKWIKGKVSYYKELRGGVFPVENVPRSPSGKLLRRILRDQARSEIQRQAKAHM